MSYYKKVNTKNRKAMVDFLTGHFRYDTMNSWNAATSYAHNVKIHRVIPSALRDKAYALLDVDGSYDEINMFIKDWNREQNYQYQAYFNGRSGGYLVFCRGGQEPSGYKSHCKSCGQKNYKTVEETKDNKCGRCGEASRVNDTTTHMRVFTQPGKGIDMDEDFTEWTIEDLLDRVKLVQSFDKLCDDVVAAFIYLCEHFDVKDETIVVEKTVKVLVEK